MQSYLCQRMLSLVGICLGSPSTPGIVKADPCTVPLMVQAYFSLPKAEEGIEASKLAACKSPCSTSTATLLSIHLRL